MAKLAQSTEGTTVITPVICIGDVHGHYNPLLQLWKQLDLIVGTEIFERSTIIFLGDFNDRGPQTKLVFDWLVTLDDRYPSQKHVYLYGNHDFSFAAFLGALPPTNEPSFDWKSTWQPFLDQEFIEGWWEGPGVENMHVQGRRWGGLIKKKVSSSTLREYKGSTYDSKSTFESYGVSHGDREGLIAAVPQSHKDFLRNRMVFIHEEDGMQSDDPKLSFSRLIGVHAGLETDKPLEPQLNILRSREITVPRLEALSGRKNVWNIHPDLEREGALLISGHHGVLSFVSDQRLVVDESGGVDGQPLAAIILPERKIVRHTNNIDG